MKNNINKIAKDTNIFLKKFIKKQKKTELLVPMQYGLLPGGKKIRSKILIDVGKIFNINYNVLIMLGAAVECIHAYSLIHDDLPCMDNDFIRRGKPTAHIKFGEATAVLAGNSLLTLAFEILSDKKFKINEKIKIELIKKLSISSGHSGIAGGQFLDLHYEKKRVSAQKIVNMQLKKTGKLFSFCSSAPAIISKKNKKIIRKFEVIGSDVGLLFQIADDLIDFQGDPKKAGKKTKKDQRLGKATLISLLGYENTVIYANKLMLEIKKKLKNYGKKSNNLNNTIKYILTRNE
ncbi:polyprenyl synthetase family protein [Candidatus Pelagibacter sp.]|nr:polyprenyl synthetase family protein [Candidatus Pelagibacter sp.]